MTELLQKFLSGDRRALAKVITIFESKKEEDILLAREISNKLTKIKRDTIRIGISGPPGVGKSTFINSVGNIILGEGLKLAVLAVDPSSELSGGSLLADKIRMESLLSQKDAYIRPSPSQCLLGGINTSTKDVMMAVESFGFDVVVIESVGVGQSESLLESLVDHFVMLIQPGAGDDIQAIKKGNMQVADFILVNKADGHLENLAKNTFYSLKTDYKDKVFTISAKENIGILEIWQKIKNHRQNLLQENILIKNRSEKLKKYINHVFFEHFKNKLAADSTFQEYVQNMSYKIEENKTTFNVAISHLVDNHYTSFLEEERNKTNANNRKPK